MSLVYILHSDTPIGGSKQQARHYAGFTKRDFDVRHKEHLYKNNKVPILRAFHAAGAKFEVGRIFENVDRSFEHWLKRVNRNLKDYCRVCREERIIKKQIGWKLMKRNYYLIGASEDLGKTIAGRPRVVNGAELCEERRKCEEATGGNWDIVVLHEFTVNHYDPDFDVTQIGDRISINGQGHLPVSIKCKGLPTLGDRGCPNEANRPNDNEAPEYCDECYETLVEWAIEEQAEKEYIEAEERARRKEDCHYECDDDPTSQEYPENNGQAEESEGDECGWQYDDIPF